MESENRCSKRDGSEKAKYGTKKTVFGRRARAVIFSNHFSSPLPRFSGWNGWVLQGCQVMLRVKLGRRIVFSAVNPATCAAKTEGDDEGDAQ